MINGKCLQAEGNPETVVPAALRLTLWATQFPLEQPPPHAEGFGTVWPGSGAQ